MLPDELQEIEAVIKQGRAYVETGLALDRLKNNRDFKKIIMDGYFNQEAIRLVHLKADPDMQSPERQAAIIKQIDAIGALESYFNTIFFHAAQAEKQIADSEQMRDELLAEEMA